MVGENTKERSPLAPDRSQHSIAMLSAFLDDVTDRSGSLPPQRMSGVLRVPLSHLARIARAHRNSLSQHPKSPAVQARLGRWLASSRRHATCSAADRKSVV